MPLGWRHALMLQLGYNESSKFEESNFATVSASATGHLPLSLLVDSCYAVYQLQNTRVPFPAGIPAEPGCGVCTLLHPPFCPPQQVLWLHIVNVGNHHGIGFDMSTIFYPGSRSCILPYNFHAVITSVRM